MVRPDIERAATDAVDDYMAEHRIDLDGAARRELISEAAIEMQFAVDQACEDFIDDMEPREYADAVDSGNGPVLPRDE